MAGRYRAVLAQQRADVLAATPRGPPPLAQDGVPCSQVQRLLRAYYSPEQIAGMLHRMNPNDPRQQVSHETIYTALYAMPRSQLRTGLIACLRQARKSHRPCARGQDRRGVIPNMTGIHERPCDIVSQPELDAIAWQLNTRVRKSLDWKCPAKLFMSESLDFFEHHHQLVALRN